MRCLRGTWELRLVFRKNKGLDIAEYANSDFARYEGHRRFVTGSTALRESFFDFVNFADSALCNHFHYQG